MSGLSLSTSSEVHSNAPDLLSPASRLRLAIPKVSHIQIDSEELQLQFAENGAPTGKVGKYTIIDVRSDDYTGGHIVGSLHIPVDQFERDLDSLIEQAHKAQTSKIVFVCCYGKQRSPLAAEMFLSKFKTAYGEDAAPEAFVLTSGFSGLLNSNVTISNDKSVALKAEATKYIADFDASKWTVAAVSRTPSNRDGAASAFQLVYKNDVESALVFIDQKKQ